MVRKKDNSYADIKLEDLLKSPLWYNSQIRINNVHVYYTWHEKGILYINDLTKDDGTLLTYEEFIIKYQLNTHFIEFEGLLQSVKLLFRKYDLVCTKKLHDPWIPYTISDILKDKRGSKRMYNILRSNSLFLLQKLSGKISFLNITYQ